MNIAWWHRFSAPTGLPPQFISHSLRHLYASTALAEGIPITESPRWPGHNSIEVILQIYGHLIPYFVPGRRACSRRGARARGRYRSSTAFRTATPGDTSTAKTRLLAGVCS